MTAVNGSLLAFASTIIAFREMAVYSDKLHVSIILEDIKSQRSANLVEILNKHFEHMVRSEEGVSYVQTEDDVYYPKLVEEFISKIVGSAGKSFFKVTGSASQMLKCVTESNQGDADVLLLSSFPKMSREYQEEVLFPCGEHGFYRIKQNDMKMYPFVKRERVKYLNANSLRNFESIWFHRSLQLPLFVVESLDHEFEKAKRAKLASVLSWTSSSDSKRNPLNTYPVDKEMIYFHILKHSYKMHILPILNEMSQKHAGKVIDALELISDTSSNFGKFRAKDAYESLLKLGSEFDNGIVSAYLGYYRENQRNSQNFIDENKKDMFIELSRYFQMVVTEDEVHEEDYVFKEKKLTGSFDLVPAIACEGFPSIAKNWAIRVEGHAWPSQEVVSKALEAGFHVVPKPSKGPDNDPSTMFRLSFNKAETLLAKTLNQFQRECFRVFKMFFYDKLKQEPKVLATYHLKTVFFWTLEETDAELWKPENRAYCCLLLLQYLRESLVTMRLRHYFIPEHNLFQHMSKQDTQQVLQELDKIIADPIAASGQTINDIRDFYAKKQKDKLHDNHKAELHQFFTKSELLFKKALVKIKKEPISLQWPDNSTERVSELLSEDLNKRILQFMFDLIYARTSMARYHKNFKKYAPLPSPIAMLVQVLLPLLDEITKEVLLPQVPKEMKFIKKFQNVESAIHIASLLSYDDVVNLAMLRSRTAIGLDNAIDLVSSAFKLLTGGHDEL